MSKTGGQGRAPSEVADSCLHGVAGTSSRRGGGHTDELRREEHDRRGEPRAATGGKDQMSSGKGVRSSYPPAAEISARSRHSPASTTPNRACVRLGDAYQRLVAPPRRQAPTRRLRP